MNANLNYSTDQMNLFVIMNDAVVLTAVPATVWADYYNLDA